MEAAAAIGAVASVAGPVIEGVGGYRAGQYNNRVAKLNARNALSEGRAEEEQLRMQGRQIIGEQLARQAEGGGAIGTGTALDALVDSQVSLEMDALNIRRKAQLGAASMRQQGALAKMEGEYKLIGGAVKAVAAGANYAGSQ